MCDADIAYLILDRSMTDDVRILEMALHNPVKTGQEVVPIGYGGGVTNVFGDRRAREKSSVLSTGPIRNPRTDAAIGPHEFEVSIPTCRGDSGGPAVDDLTGRVVGVVSRGTSCLRHGNHVYTRVDAYADLTRTAFAAAERALDNSDVSHVASVQ